LVGQNGGWRLGRIAGLLASSHAHKIGWRESCLLDIVSPRAAAPVLRGTSKGAPLATAEE
jgi:hypothetical protein